MIDTISLLSRNVPNGAVLRGCLTSTVLLNSDISETSTGTCFFVNNSIKYYQILETVNFNRLAALEICLKCYRFNFTKIHWSFYVVNVSNVKIFLNNMFGVDFIHAYALTFTRAFTEISNFLILALRSPRFDE